MGKKRVPRKPRVKQPAPLPRVASNILGNVKKLGGTIHKQVYANGNGYSPGEILDALGEKGDYVVNILASVDRINAPISLPEPPEVPVLVVPAGQPEQETDGTDGDVFSSLPQGDDG